MAVLHHPHQQSIALLLIETESPQRLEILRNGNPFPIMAMNCPDIEYTHGFLRNKGVEVEELMTLGNGEAKYFYFRDPEGNLLEGAWSIWDPVDDYKDF
ncbi:hypothetical protein HMSSN139_15080 [Paenibacillus sp. HMSSN-139]|nr:hypothetical protein HMSSN139_15080 [Paenibacillus sp. HMSSN-139]